MAEIFEFQDAIREQIVSALEVSLTPTDQAATGRKPTTSVEAYDLFLRGRGNFHRYTSEHLQEAMKCFEAAIEIDPKFADAYGYLSFCHFRGWVQMWPGFDVTLDKALELAEKGVALDGTSGMALARLGWIQTWLRRYDPAVASLEKAVVLEPGNAEIHATFGDVINFFGEPERALELVDKAFSMDTFAPPIWEYYAGKSHYLLRQYDEALSKFDLMAEWAPMFIHSYAYQACVYVELGRLEEASAAIEKLLKISPQYTLKEAARTMPFRRDEDSERVLSALRKAGLPGGEDENVERSPLPGKPSIAVLPFDNMSGDPEQEYFADGIAEDLITALSRFRWFFVIARNSSFTYKGKAVDVKQVAAELGVQYVIEGSVRKASNRVRITAQLIDAATGRHVWAERYDRDLSDIFEVQDEITTAIIGAVGPLFAAAETQRASRKAPENLDAWDLAMRANGHVWRVNKTDLKEAQRLFAEALELDPNSSFAQSGLSFAYLREAGAGLADDFQENRDIAYKAALRAIELDEHDARGHLSLAWVYHVRQENELAATECRTALRLNPNLADAEGFLGLINAHLGHYEEALLHIDQAVQLSPQDPSMHFWNLTPVIAALVANRPQEYFEHSKELTELSPNFIPGIRHLAAASANLGHQGEAELAVGKALILVPNDTITSILESVPIADPAARDRYIDGLRKAGYPE